MFIRIIYIILNCEPFYKTSPGEPIIARNWENIWGTCPKYSADWFTHFTCSFPITSLMEKTVNSFQILISHPDIFKHSNGVL